MTFDKNLLETGALKDVDAYLQDLLSKDWQFIQAVPEWGWILYQRDANHFEPTISKYLTDWSLKTPNPAWLELADRNDHVKLYRILKRKEQLHQKKNDWRKVTKHWKSWFIEGLPYANEIELKKAMLWTLDDDLLSAIYKKQPDQRDVVRTHIEAIRWRDEGFPLLSDAVEAEGDEDFALLLYKRLQPPDDWGKDIIRWSKEIDDDQQLNAKLIKHALEGDLWQHEKHYLKLAQTAGQRVAPFLKHQAENDPPSWNHDPWVKILKLAEEDNWNDVNLWRAVVRKRLRSDQWNKIVADILDKKPLDIATLLSIANVPADWGTGLKPFTPEVGLKLYQLSPDLASTLSGHYVPSYQHTFQPVFELAVKNNDDAFADMLAAKASCLHLAYYQRNNAQKGTKFIKYYDSLDDETFAQRAVNILSQLPREPLFGYSPNELMTFLTKTPNRIASANLAPLLESEHFMAKLVALQILEQSPERAAAPEIFRHLRGILLWRSQRRLQIKALQVTTALGLTGHRTDECVALIRDTFELEQKWFPRDRAVKALGELLAAYPEHRTASEKPMIYRRGA